MTAETDVKGLIRRTQQYEFSDGLRDLQLSIILGLGGVMVWFVFTPTWVGLLGTLIARYGRWAAWAGLLLVFLPAAVAWAALALMRLLRRRWLWASSGDVKPLKVLVPRRVNIIATIVLVSGIGIGVVFRALGIADDGFVLRMLWTATGWSFGYTLYGMGREIGLERYVKIGLIGGVASTLIAAIPMSFAVASLVLGLGWAVILTASGLLTLRRAWLVAGRGSDVRPD